MTTDFLTAFHGSSPVPKVPLVALVESVMSAEVQGLERITKGYANEVYRVALSQGPPVYVRIRRHGRVAFADEAWALEACRRAGVLVPTVHTVTTLEAPEPLEVMILAAVPGRPLGEVWDGLPEVSRRQVMTRVGAALRVMHGIALDGWGRRGAGAAWEYGDWKTRAVSDVRDRETDMPTLREVGFTRAETDSFMAIVRQMTDLSAAPPILCHGDLGLDHLFVDDALNLTGIIDFGMWQGGPRELDFAMLRMYHPDVPLGWLESGYSEVPLDREFDRRVLIEQINVGTGFLAFDVRRGNVDYLPLAFDGLRGTLRAWEELERG